MRQCSFCKTNYIFDVCLTCVEAKKRVREEILKYFDGFHNEEELLVELGL